MNRRRRKLVHLAFGVMDKDASGFLDFDDVASCYNAKMHPDVLSRKKTEKQVLAEFLDGFDVGGEKDGKVTVQEFENYYKAVSASIDNDDYFELMIRNAWHISGGEGWCANTSNRRVLVTHADGTQTVEEVKDDIGISASDGGKISANLRQQGLNATKVEYTYGDKPDSNTNNKGYGRGKPNLSIGSRGNSNQKEEPVTPAIVEKAITKMKDVFASRGAHGVIGLGRKFKMMDVS